MDNTAPVTNVAKPEFPVLEFGTIWVWSILCVIVVWLLNASGPGLLMLAGGARSGEGYLVEPSMVVASIASILEPVALLFAMWHLYQFLSHGLLPLLFSGADPAADHVAAPALRRAFAALLFGLAVRVAGLVISYPLRLTFRPILGPH